MDGMESELRKYDLTFGHESELDALLWSDPAMRRTEGIFCFVMIFDPCSAGILVCQTLKKRGLHMIREFSSIY
jgi:hypothetical protein